MKSLLILRHAEAAPASAAVPDRQRPLTEEGAAQARRLGEQMRARGLAFDRALCSPALRARETGEALIAAGGFRAPLDLADGLYDAPGEAMLQQLRARTSGESHLLLIAHMPGVAELVSLLTTERGLSLVFQACTLAEIALDLERWEDVQFGSGALRLLLPP